MVPVRLREGRELDVVVADVVSQMERVAAVLAAHQIVGRHRTTAFRCDRPAIPDSGGHDIPTGDAPGQSLSDPVGG